LYFISYGVNVRSGSDVVSICTSYIRCVIVIHIPLDYSFFFQISSSHVSDLVSRLDSGRVTPIKAEKNAREWLAKIVCTCSFVDIELPARRFLDRGRIGYLARRQAEL